MKLSMMLLAAVAAALCCWQAAAAPPSETIKVHIENGGASRDLSFQMDEFTPRQQEQLLPLTRSKRGLNVHFLTIIFKIVAMLLGLPKATDPILIVIALVGRLLGVNINDELLVLEQGIATVSGLVNPQ